MTSRFADAGDPAWTPPAESELREHFADRFLGKIPPEKLVPILVGRVAGVREDLVVTADTPQMARARVAGLQIHAGVEAEPPHRLIGLRLEPLGSRVTDTRVGSPPMSAAGAVPASVAGIADEAFAEFGRMINSDRGVAGMAGHGPGADGSLVVGLDGGDVHVALTNRRVTIEPVSGRVRRSLSEAVNRED